jgi:hypothetical protein
MKNTRKFIYFAVIAAIGFVLLSLTGCQTPDDGVEVPETGKETAARPVATPPAGAVPSGEKLTLTTATKGAEIWYTTNGNTPAKNGEGSAKYTSPFEITPPVTVKAIAVKDGMNDSAILEAAYSVAPAFIPNDTDIPALTENVWSEGNLTSSIGEQWFMFTATADTQYIHAGFGTLSSILGMYVQVYDSNGAAVGTETNLDNSTKYISSPVTPEQEYYIKVRRYSSISGNGTYQIAFNKSSTAPAVTVTLPSNATPLTENIWSDGNLTSFSPEQWFMFTATADTQYIYAGFGTLSSTFGMYVQVYDSNGAAVGTETNLNSRTIYISRSVTPGQEYYIKVRRYSSTYNGTYQIAFNKSSTAVPRPSNAIPLTENIWAGGELSSSSPEQWFKFTATDDTQYIHAGFGTMSSLMGMYVHVYDSSGDEIGSETNLYSNKKNVSISVTLGEEYYIKVRRYSSYNGTYQIAFNKSSAAPTLPSSAITLTENVWTGGNLTSSTREQWFKFTATDNTQYIHVSFGTLSPSVGLKVQVCDSSSVAVGTETILDYRTKYFSISVTAEQVYYINVQSYDFRYTGTYNISFNKSPTAPSATVTLPSSASTLTENTWANGTLLSSGSVQWYQFNATADTQYIHAAFGTIITTTGMNVQVYDSSGASVVTDSLLYGTGDSSFISISVTQGQTYYIKVWPNFYTGSYQIAFNKSETAPGINLPTGNVTSLKVNTWTNGNFDELNSKQWFSFIATANPQYIIFNADTINPFYSVIMQVYDSSGVKVGNMTMFRSTSYMTISVMSGQVYYIQVWPAIETGTYQIGFTPTKP